MVLGKHCLNLLTRICFLMSVMFWEPATCKQDGAPEEACINMSPGHISGAAIIQSQPLNIAPYQINIQQALDTLDGPNVISVTIASLPSAASSVNKDALALTANSNNGALDNIDNTRFKGFFLQARSLTLMELIGTWNVDLLNGTAKLVNCFGIKGSAVTHTNPIEKDEITVNWIPPLNYQGNITFVATVVESFDRFWIGLQSKSFTLQSVIKTTNIDDNQTLGKNVPSTVHLKENSSTSMNTNLGHISSQVLQPGHTGTSVLEDNGGINNTQGLAFSSSFGPKLLDNGSATTLSSTANVNRDEVIKDQMNSVSESEGIASGKICQLKVYWIIICIYFLSHFTFDDI